MAYVTGTALSFSALLTAFRNACTTNGFTLSGNVLHKGTLYAECFLSVPYNVGSGTPPTNGAIHLRAGNGIDGANALTTPAPVYTWIGRLGDGGGLIWPDWDWPVTYHIHINSAPDEVCMMVNYGGGARWQHLFFGQSPVAGNAGTGNWQSATAGFGGALDYGVADFSISPDGGRPGFGSQGGVIIPAPFWWGAPSTAFSADDATLGSHVHGVIDETTGLPRWSHATRTFENGSDHTVSAAVTARPLLVYSPNLWNGETLLVPIQVAQARPSSKSSIIAELKHVRMCRNDFLADGAVIDLTPDKWKIYPCHRRNTLLPLGGAKIDHSGTVAMALRYDGP